MSSACNVRVVARFRPVNKRETEEGGANSSEKLHFTDTTVDVVTEPGKKPETYTFDRVFWGSVTQQEVYNYTAKDTIEDIVKGYNGTIFAYGQTGAGKSFTMFGPSIDDEIMMGIIPRSCRHIFSHIAKRASEGVEFTIKCSFLEIYKEVVRDLLNPKNQNLKVRETPSKGVWVENLTEEFVTCENDIFELLKLGEKFRAVSFTKMNAESSRSHSLFILSLQQKTRDGSTKTGKLNLADLAGSEKVGKTGATGQTLEEAKKINQSLSALGNCINALTKAKRGHVPYRDSKLTHILRESLGGNSKTTLIVACSPHEFNLDETLSTLKFAQRAKSIKNTVKVNAQRSVEELNAIIEKLKRELTMLRSYAAKLEDELRSKMPAGWDPAAFRSRLLGAGPAPAPHEDEDGEEADVPSSPASPLSSTPAASPRPSTPQSPVGTLSPSASAPSSPSASAPSSPRGTPSGPLAGLLAALAASGNYDPLMLAELQVDLEKFSESTLEQLNDLKEEVASLTEKGKRRKEKAKLLKEALTAAEDALRRAKEEGEAATTEIKRLDFAARQAQLEAEKLAADVKSLTSANQEYAETLKKEQEKTAELTAKLTSAEARAATAELSLETANTANKELHAKTHQLEDALSVLRGEHKLTEVKLAESEKEKQDAMELASRLRDELAGAKAAHADTETRLRSVIAEKERTEHAHDKQKRRADELERQLQTTTADLKDKTARLAEAEKLAQDQRERAEKAEAAIARLRAVHEEADAEIGRLKSEGMRLTAAVQRAELEAKLHEERAGQEAARVSAVEARLQAAEDAAAKAAAESETHVRELRDQIERLNASLVMATNAKRDAEARLEDLERAFAEKTQELEALAEEHRALLQQQAEGFRKLEEVASEKENEKGELEAQLGRIRQERAELETKLKSTAERLEGMRAEAERLRASEREKDRALLAADEHLRMARNELEEERARHTKASSALSELQLKYVGLMKENNEAHEKQKELSRQLGKLQEGLHEKDVEIRRLMHEKELADAAIATSKKRIEELEQELAAASEASKADRVKLSTLTVELAAKSETLEQLMARLAASETALTDTAAENGQLAAQLAEKKALVERLEADKLAMERQLSSETARAATAVAAAAAARTSLEETKVAMTTQLGDAERRVERAEQAVEAERKLRTDAESRLAVLRAELAALEQKIALLKKELSDLQRKYDEATAKNSISEKQLESANKRLEEMAADILRKQEANEALKKELKEFQAIHSEVIESLKEQILLLREVERISAEKPRVRIVKPVYEQRSIFNMFAGKEKTNSARSPSASPSATSPTNGSSPTAADDAARPPMPTVADLSSPERDGWLTKQGGFIRNWKKRWFVLKDDMLYYFVDNGKTTMAKGVVDLDGVLAQPADDIAKRKNTIGLFHDTRRTFFLSSNDKRDLEAWQEAINNAATNIYKRRHASRQRSASTIATAPPKIAI